MPRTKKKTPKTPASRPFGTGQAVAIAQKAVAAWFGDIEYTRLALTPGTAYNAEFNDAFEAVSKAIRKAWGHGKPSQNQISHLEQQIRDALTPELREAYLVVDDDHNNEWDIATETGYLLGVQVGLRLRGAR